MIVGEFKLTQAINMADLEAVLADVSYLMAMEKSKSTPAARASKKIVLPDPRWVSGPRIPSVCHQWRRSRRYQGDGCRCHRAVRTDPGSGPADGSQYSDRLLEFEFLI